jgi:hypothetical protein
MSNILPKIDKRNQQDLVSELRNLILEYCPEWKSMDELESDKQTDALIHIFSNMAGNGIENLNQAPEKNFIAFLNLIGISLTPPRVAKAPLVFKLKDDLGRNGFVPAGVKVSAQPENQEEVVFETEKDLMVIQSRMVKAASIEPGEDRWSNHDFLFSLEPTGNEAELFRGDLPVLHRIYLGHSKLFNFTEPAAIDLSINIKQPGASGREVKWYCFDEDGKAIPLHIASGFEEASFLKSGDISFSNVVGIASNTISGYDKTRLFKNWINNWIYAELKSPLTDQDIMPDIEDIRIKLSISPVSPIRPETVLCNGSLLDSTKDFYPFGPRPVFNDTFYIASREAFSKENALITMDVVLSDEQACPHPDTENIRLNWEYWDGSQWRLISETTNSGVTGNIIVETTRGFTSSGTITFRCPEVKPYSVNGMDNCWIRIRITGGNYGVEGELKPPSIKEMTINYTYSVEEFPEAVITENNFTMADRTVECLTEGKYFEPFSPCTDLDPAFYLAFDQDISNMPVSLFFPLSGDQLGENPVVAWEYWNGRKWLALSVNDAIRHFTRREILQFYTPSDLTKRPLFGAEHYWIRARLESGGYRFFPKLNTIYSNAVWAHNSNAAQDVILGSSNGEPGQTFQIPRVPVLPGEMILVCETLGKGEWVCWQEVSTFSLSGTDSRHYMLDRSNGTLVFGDGKSGMIPPAGIDNIKCNYRYGGGTKGNVKAGLISQIWDNCSDIDLVENPVPADGGFDQEDVDQAKIRGPHTLKSRDRGVTYEDIEWLVREAIPQIAKVKCLPTMDRNLRFVPGKATVIIVPDCNDPKPAPSQELLNEIDAYLSARTSAVVTTEKVPRIDVIGPDYIRVGVEAGVTYTLPESSKIIEGRIIDSLKQFLDPLYGGPDKKGGEFGRNLYVSEVYSVIKNVQGVDYVTDISIKASVQCFTLNLEMQKERLFKPDVTYSRYSAVKSSDNRIIFALAQKLEAKAGVKTLLVKGFKENDRIMLRYKNYPPEELVVVSVSGDLLECQTVDGEPLDAEYPVGSDVEAAITPDLTIRSYTLNQITGRPESFFLKIAVPEARDIFFLSRNDEYANTTPLKVREVRLEDIFLEEDELVYSGTHFINKKPELIFPYLLDKETGTIHDLSNTTPECHLGQISKEDRMFLKKLSEAPEAITCKYCFPVEE